MHQRDTLKIFCSKSNDFKTLKLGDVYKWNEEYSFIITHLIWGDDYRPNTYTVHLDYTDKHGITGNTCESLLDFLEHYTKLPLYDSPLYKAMNESEEE